MEIKKPLISRRPRIFWSCTHVALRYEEVPAAIDAGFEVIPSLGSMIHLPYEERFDDENMSLYPEWRLYCTLPSNILECLRRVQFDGLSPPTLSEQEIDLFNKYIDVIFIPSMPASVKEALSWFKGIVVFRIFGRIADFNSYSELCESRSISLETHVKENNFVLAPMFSNLAEIEKEWLKVNVIVFRTYISFSRIPFVWEKDKSRPYVSTMIKRGTEANSTGKQRLSNLITSVGTSTPCRILGKQWPADIELLSENFKFSGFLPHEEFFTEIAKSRAFIYIGDDPYHLHFTPLEAIAMGVPVFFHYKSPLCQELIREGFLSVENINAMGAYESYEEIHSALSYYFNDFDYLIRLSQYQKFTVEKLFNKQSVVDSYRRLISFLPNNYVGDNDVDLICSICRAHPNKIFFSERIRG
jgi:hypothetical protein